MIIRKKLPRAHGLNEPILHGTTRVRCTRRDFISRRASSTGPRGGRRRRRCSACCANPRSAQRRAVAGPSTRMHAPPSCNIQAGAGKIPFICFDLAGGANLTGSEVLIGKQGGQLDFLSTAGYAKLGLPGNMVPNAPNAASATNNFIDTRSVSPSTRTARSCAACSSAPSPATQARTNGVRRSRPVPRTIRATIRTTRCTASARPARAASC